MAQESIFQSFRHAWNGIRRCFAAERNMKIHFAAAILAITLAWRLGFSRTELAVVLLAVAAVLVAELFNTALEAIVDLMSPEIHPLAGLAKDIAAGAVLLTAVTAVLIACLLYIPHLVN
ncbi:MAG TPA: diacylglycerol kinase family protein [Selenomonadales bacterium]|nr:diacylglycerol kinase family protein [Selenomonadales bacterium]